MNAACPPPALPARLQDLPPAWARFCLGVEQTLVQALKSIHGRHVLLACSAGGDSLALLLIMRCLRPRLRLRLTAAHLDHALRPESPNEAAFLALLCAQAEIELLAGRSATALYARKTSKGLEEAGRILRYRFLLGKRQRIGADLVMTAHHADDLAEDVLMRLMRGAGWPGLAGMPAWDPDRRLLRPLLHAPKATLQAFLHDLGVQWREDPSNTDRRFLRNRIRETVLPPIRQEAGDLHGRIARINVQGALDRDYFSGLLSPLIVRAGNQGGFVNRSVLDGLHPAVRIRLYKCLLDDLGPGQARHDALMRLERAWQARRTSAVIQFPGGKSVTITARGMQFAAARTSQQRSEMPCDSA